MKFILDCEIIAHQELAPGYKRMVLHAPAIAEIATPGQFCMLEIHEGLYPFLRRPMSIEHIYKDAISILYKVVGEGTRLLAQIQTGTTISVQGPLGNGFPLPKAYERYILVAGGIGIAPFPALAEQVMQELGYTPEIVIAARNRSAVLLYKDFSRMGCPVTVITDDGSEGMKGFASDALRRLEPDEHSLIYCCGPMVMMAAVHDVCTECNAICYASLEAEMACGDGVCMGCVVETTANDEAQRMVRVCREGPIFDTRQIDWKERMRS